MKLWRETKTAHSAVLFSAIIFFLWYLPWLDPKSAGIIVHDNMDGAVVINSLFGNWVKDNRAWSAALNGNLPIYTYSGLTQPLSLIYAAFSAPAAYLFTDFIVRSIAFTGTVLLGKELRLDNFLSSCIAMCFAFSISYTSYLLSIAGIPILTWMILTCSKGMSRKNKIFIALSLFVGINSSLALSGLFFLVLALPIIQYGFVRKIQFEMILILSAYGFGLMIGSLGLIYAQFFSGITWHRVEFERTFPSDYAISFFSDVLELVRGRSWYHVTSFQPVLWGGLAILLAASKPSRAHYFFFLIFVFAGIWIIFKSPLGAFLYKSSPFLKQIQIDRFYFLSSILIIYSCIAYSSESKTNANLITAILIIQIGFSLYYSPGWAKIMGIGSKTEITQKISTFQEYYQPEWFDKNRKIVGDSAVMSVGHDPMIALMNGFRTIDGYFSLYPLEYKDRFRHIINQSLPESGRADYFNYWGSRIYTFHANSKPDRIDFCEAHKLGASFVISSSLITSLYLTHVEAEDSLNLFLYRIDFSQCDPSPSN